MKERFLPISILISAVIVLVGLIILSNTIQNRPFAGTSNIPSSIEVTSAQSSEYMSEWEAAIYLRIDYDSFITLQNEGKLNGTYIEFSTLKTVPDEQAYDATTSSPDGAAATPVPMSTTIVPVVERVYVKSKLDEWMLVQITP